MNRQVLVQPEAQSELEDAALWYEGKHRGLGNEFLDAADRAIDAIVTWPDAGAPVSGLPDDLDVRQAPVPGFPYHVVYLVTSDAVRVLAFAHDRRRPGYWKHRDAD